MKTYSVPSLGKALVAALALLVACGDDKPECKPLPTECQPPVPSYASDVAPIFAARCVTCHDGGPGGEWPLQSYDDVSTWGGPITIQLRNCSMPPPDSGHTLPESERETINAWLVCGAQDN
jgi:hypothetical protein